MIDEHDQRKHGSGGIEARMIQGETVPRVSRPLANADALRAWFKEPQRCRSHALAHTVANELQTALARISTLDKDIAEARKDRELFKSAVLEFGKAHPDSCGGWYEVDDVQGLVFVKDKCNCAFGNALKRIAAMTSRQQG